jgi:hypothetical protein
MDLCIDATVSHLNYADPDVDENTMTKELENKYKNCNIWNLIDKEILKLPVDKEFARHITIPEKYKNGGYFLLIICNMDDNIEIIELDLDNIDEDYEDNLEFHCKILGDLGDESQERTNVKYKNGNNIITSDIVKRIDLYKTYSVITLELYNGNIWEFHDFIP